MSWFVSGAVLNVKMQKNVLISKKAEKSQFGVLTTILPTDTIIIIVIVVLGYCLSRACGGHLEFDWCEICWDCKGWGRHKEVFTDLA